MKEVEKMKKMNKNLKNDSGQPAWSKLLLR